jgi:hypothetical protein
MTVAETSNQNLLILREHVTALFEKYGVAILYCYGEKVFYRQIAQFCLNLLHNLGNERHNGQSVAEVVAGAVSEPGGAPWGSGYRRRAGGSRLTPARHTVHAVSATRRHRRNVYSQTDDCC